MCFVVFVAIFEPPMIKDASIIKLIDNDNLSLIMSLINSMFTVFLLIFQGRDSGKKILLDYAITQPQWEPGQDSIIGLDKNHLVNAVSDSNNEHIIVIRDDRGSDFLWIPLAAKLISDIACETVIISNICITYKNDKKWKKIKISQEHINTHHKINGIFQNNSDVPIYFLLILNARQKCALRDNKFRLKFKQKIYTVDGVSRKKKVSLFFYMTDNKLNLVSRR